MSSSFIAKRLKGSGLPLHQVLPTIAQLLSQWQSMPPLCYAGSPPILIELSESGIASYIAWLNQARAISIPKTFSLSSHDCNPQLTLFIDNSEFKKIESIEFYISSNFSHQTLQLNHFINLVAKICLNFGAYQGYVYDEQLASLHGRSARIIEKLSAQTPANMHEFIPNSSVIEGVVDILSPLLLENEFDNRYVPNGIWWINFWDRIQVETVGIDQIKTAPWVERFELPEGGMILVATKELTDVKNPIHLMKLNEIVEHLHLREIQECYILTK